MRLVTSFFPPFLALLRLEFCLSITGGDAVGTGTLGIDWTLEEREFKDGLLPIFRRKSISELDGVRLAFGIPLSATDLRPWIDDEERIPDRTELAVLLVLLLETVPRWKAELSRLCLDDDRSLKADVLV